MRETTVLAPELAPGDEIIETGLAGVFGRVTAVRVLPDTVGVTMADGSIRALARFESCRIRRELAEAA